MTASTHAWSAGFACLVDQRSTAGDRLDHIHLDDGISPSVSLNPTSALSCGQASTTSPTDGAVTTAVDRRHGLCQAEAAHTTAMPKPACPLCTRRPRASILSRPGRIDLLRLLRKASDGRRLPVRRIAPTSNRRTAHPPAVVQRRRERDGGFLGALLYGLTEPQQRLTSVLLEYLAGDRPHAPGLVDGDVERAALALAQTYETASRGIVYEHPADTATAQRLAGEMKQVIEADRGHGPQSCRTMPPPRSCGGSKRAPARRGRALSDEDEPAPTCRCSGGVRSAARPARRSGRGREGQAAGHGIDPFPP